MNSRLLIRSLRRWWMGVFGVLFWMLTPYGFAAETPARVLVLPFTIHAAKDMAYLREGIADMLSTRLAVQGKTVLVDPDTAAAELSDSGDVDPAAAAAIARRTGADYVVSGSLTVIAESLSTDIRLVDAASGEIAVAYSQTGEKLADVIGHVDRFAAQARASLLGEAAVAAVPAAPPQPEPPAAQPPPQPSRPTKEAPAATGVIVTPDEDRPVGAADSLWRSKRFQFELVSLDIGDVDGDEMTETVFIGSQVVTVARLYPNGRLQTLARIENKGYNRQIHVDVADINQNGVAEIFVSNLTGETGPPASFVLEWDGSRFARIAENQPWYFRAVKSDGIAKLYGQGRTRDEVFKPGIFEMNWVGGRYDPGRQLPLPFTVNVYAFTYGDVLNDGSRAFVTFSDGAVPAVRDAAGKELWKGPDSYGGNGIYIQYQPSAMTGDIDKNRSADHFYLPNPAVVDDLNGDGLNEVITADNNMGLLNFLSRIRTYKKSTVINLSWNGSSLQKGWQSIEFTEFITDLVVGDADNDGADEIAFTVVSKTRSALSSAKSYISAINIQRELAIDTDG